ncbi:MAG: LamG-like jellyroll fold domain-containing protein, partial [Fidelibacterota bacterium]
MKNLVYRVTISLILMCNLSFSENHILYWINDGNDYEIFKYDMLLEATTQLTDNTFDDAYPVVSPNGEYIYFSSTESGVGNIWRMDMDGGNRTQLTDIQNWSANIDHLIRLDINKENTKIVFSYKIAANGGYFAMYTMDIDGSNIVEISPAVSDYTYPQWSTDGTRILCGNNVPYNGYSQQILEMNADGTGVTTLVPNSTNYPLYPRYSPDGSQITYTRADLDLYMSNLDGSNEINLTNSTGIDEALSVWGMDNWIYYRKDYEVHRISTDGQINELVIADPNYSISAFEPYYDVIDESLIAYYPIDGNSYDESGNGNGGIPMGNPSFSEVDRFGEMSSAVQFDGLDDYIDCGSGLNLNIISDQTLSFWIKTTSTYSGTILSKVLASSGTWTDDAYSISFESDGHIYYTLRNSSENQTLISNAVVNDDNWHFITVRYDQNNVLMSIYVDGIFDNSTTGPSSILSAPDLPLYIGANYTQGDGIEYPINGILDDISIYNRVLSESEIDSLYHIGAWDTDYTVAHWDFDQGTGSELTDISGNGFHGTIDGPQWVDGFHGGALWFDGVDDKVTTSLIPVYDNTESYTWEVIAKIENTDPGQTRAFLGFENSDDGEIKIGMPNQTYYSGQVWATSRSDNYASDGGNVNLFSDTTFVDNYWHHYALVRNRDNLMYYFYLDGTLVDSTEDANVNPINAESNQTLGIGCQSHNSYWDFFFSGWIDEIRLSDEALLPYQFILPVNDIWVLVDSTWGNTQDTISIPVRIESQNNLMLNSAEFTFTYDNIALTFLDVDLSNTLLETADWMYAVNETEAGLNIAGAGNNEITENGVLFNLRFIPTGETCSFVPITVTEAMFNTGSNAVTVANGGVHIEPIPNYGDVDENGMIQAYDAAVLLEHIVGEDTLVCQGLANAEVSLNDTL